MTSRKSTYPKCDISLKRNTRFKTFTLKEGTLYRSTFHKYISTISKIVVMLGKVLLLQFAANLINKSEVHLLFY